MTKSEFYEERRKHYMLPPHGKGVIEIFEITINSHDPVELRRMVSASMAAFWQADEAYAEQKQALERLRAALETMVTMLEATDACLQTWNKMGSPVNVEYGIQQARAALEATK